MPREIERGKAENFSSRFSDTNHHFTLNDLRCCIFNNCTPLRNRMSAFKAYKACVPVEWSSNLYITLVRGIPGTRKLHRRTLEALRLRKCNRTVVQANTPSLRGMLQQVKRLVVVETEEMYNARKQKEASHRALRPPLVINHLLNPANDSPQQST